MLALQSADRLHVFVINPDLEEPLPCRVELPEAFGRDAIVDMRILQFSPPAGALRDTLAVQEMDREVVRTEDGYAAELPPRFVAVWKFQRNRQ